MGKLTAGETHRLDRAIVAISVNPELGTPVPDTLPRDYTDGVEGVCVVCYVTALRSGIISGSGAFTAAQSPVAA
ncbi:hypothetical protein [Streptomyces atratus]|uniref:hypothetical protein n=1 Tax=Streptomyces atratus TaxID=1893 RepID=UPI001E5A16BE|nr:hypothetical protein [Streptomyces atratus]